ncbi:MAG: glycosyltransferase family 4 protein [Chloroflexales bacterium]|nr:glycosyltransferase family 4 protein [Chloroflexales bacterium]
MTKIGYVVHVRTPGSVGGETRSYQVAQALAASGMHVHLYGKIDPAFQWAQHIYPHQLSWPMPKAAAQLVYDLTRYEINVAIERYHFPIFNAAYFAQRLRKKPIIFEVHGFPIDEFRLMKQSNSTDSSRVVRALMKAPTILWEKLQLKLFQHGDHFIVTSTGTQRILQKLGVPAERISVVYNCVDPVLFDPVERDRAILRRSFGLPEQGKIVLYAGSLFHEELMTIIAAAASVVKRDPQAHFLFVGQGSRTDLTLAAQQQGLSVEHISLLSPVPHQRMPDLLAACDVVLAAYALNSERFRHSFHYSPLKLMEALAMAKPVVTVDAAELRELFGHVSNVQFAQSGCSKSWAAQIEAALATIGDAALAQGRMFVLDGYRWQDAALRYSQIVQQVEENRR